MDTKDHNADATSPEAFAPNPGLILPAADLLEHPGTPILTPNDASPELAKRAKKPRTPFQESLLRFSRDKRAMVSVGALIFLILLAIVGPPIYTHIGGTYNSDFNGQIGPTVYHDFAHQELSHANEGPSAEYWFGTDGLGRDLFARLMQGLLISMLVAFLVEVVDIVLGVGIGVLAGYYGGWIDQFLARFTDLMFAFPSLLFIILIAGIFGPKADAAFHWIPILGAPGNARIVLLIIGLSITIWPLMARYVRGQTLQLKEQQFVEAARTSGTSDLRIIMSHIIPNVFSLVFIAATLNVANTIISEAGISLLGLGVQDPGSSIGLMISNGLDQLQAGNPWQALFPTIVLTIIVLAISFLGDGLRDAFDPRSKD
ncbi:MAG TPA: ABC transporter permease [Ktedonobacteraceae bacterium]|nr:ABC transporter permease [Ktedonobacteraceae bacterium]